MFACFFLPSFLRLFACLFVFLLVPPFLPLFILLSHQLPSLTTGSSNCSQSVNFALLSKDPHNCKAIKRWQSLELNIFITGNCNTSDAVNITWSLARLKTKTKIIGKTKTVFSETTDRKRNFTSSWKIEQYSLPYGTYCVDVTAQMGSLNLKSLVNYTYGFLEISESLLRASISGPKITYHQLIETLVLDAGRSYDPDVPDEERALHHGMSFTWYCKRENETFPRDLTSLPLISAQIGSHVNTSGCYGTGPGKLKFNGTKLKLDLERMQVGVTYEVKLVISKGKEREASVSHIFSHVTNADLKISIR